MKKLLTQPSVLTSLKTFNKNIAIFALLFSMCAHSSSAVNRSCAEDSSSEKDSKPTFRKKYDYTNDPDGNHYAFEKYLSNMCRKEIKNCAHFNDQEAWDISIIFIDTIIQSIQDSLNVMKKSLEILDPNRFKDIRPSVHSRKLKEDALSNQSLILSLATGETDEHVKCFGKFISIIEHLTTYYRQGLVFGNPLIDIRIAMKNFFKAFHDCDKSYDEKIPLLEDALTIMRTNLDQLKILAQNWIK